MKLNKYSSKFFTALSLLLLVFFSSFLNAEPTIDRANLRFGFSPRIKRFSWGTLNCRLINPDSKSYNIEIRFVDANRGAINHKTVFSDIIYLPPKTIIQYSAPVMTEDAEEYRMEVFVDGKETKKNDTFIISLMSGNSTYLVILNDSDDVSLGSFATTPEFKGVFASSTFAARQPPQTWSLIKKAATIVVVRPDFSRYPTDAFQAILNYVRQGGNIVFADPVGVLEASKTPLAVLLPVVPLRIRKVRTLAPLSKMFPDFKGFSGSVDFLESLPLGDGIDLLKDGNLPVYRWKKYGLGTCRFSAVPVYRSAYTTSKPWLEILKFFLAHQTVSNDLSTAVPALDEMTGFSVPGLDAVRMLFLIYFILLIIPLGLGLILKRTGTAWIVTGIITVLFSLYILKTASSGHSQQRGIFVSFIETSIPGVNASPGEGWYGIFSSSDIKLDIKAKNYHTKLSAIPPPDNIMAMFKANGLSGKTFSQPTEVKTTNALPEISALNLNANMSRQFYAAFDKTDTVYYDAPELHYTKTGDVFKPWKIPGDLKPSAAWLQYANGISPLLIKGDTIVSDKASEAVFASDTTLKSVQHFMQKGWKHTSPMLVMLENSKNTMLGLPKNILAHGKKLIIIPVREISESNRITVPYQSLLMSPGDTSTRLVMTGNEIKSEIVSRSDSDYIFRYQLPPLFAGLKAERIEVDFKYLNEGGNVEIKPGLQVGSILKKKFVKKRDVQGTDKGNGKYVFTDVSECINDGTGFIALKIKIKRTNLPIGERLRANKWSLKKLAITVTGTMPESVQSFKF